MFRIINDKLNIGDKVYVLTHDNKIIDGHVGEIHFIFHEDRTISVYYGIKANGLTFSYPTKQVYTKLNEAIKYRDEQELIKQLNNGKSTK